MTLFDLKGKTALITGASRGLGERFSLTLAEAGAKVILVSRTLDKLNELAGEIKKNGGQAIPIELDVVDKARVKSAIEELTTQGEKVDILINNAAIFKPTPIFEQEDQNEFEDVMQTDVIGLWNMTKLVANHMKNHQIAGSIINISSVNGANRLREDIAAYCAAKAGVIQLTKALVGELSRAKIRINCIVPGLFHTPATDYRVNTAEARKKAEEMIPLGFVPDPRDLDGLILYLASNKASQYVTGSCITIDGGVSWGGVTT